MKLAAAALLFTSCCAAHAQTDGLHATFPTADGKVKIVFDFTGAPDLKDWATTQAAPALVEWYPKICALLPSPGFHCSDVVYISFKDIDPPAYTEGNHITAKPAWFRAHPGDANALVHEATHVVQAYGGGHNPGWLVEGLDDYIRYYVVEPDTHSAEISPKRAPSVHYNDAYRTTANFLHWVVTKYGADVIPKLNAAMREHRYSDATWVDLTGKHLEDLGAAWKQTLPGVDAATPPPASPKPGF